MAILPSSVLSKAIKELPESWQIQHAGVRNALKKKGVKDEELQYSGMDQALENISPENLQNIGLTKEVANKPITKADLVEAEAARADTWSEAHKALRYKNIVAAQHNPDGTTITDLDNYQVNIRTFNESNKIDTTARMSKIYDIEQRIKRNEAIIADSSTAKSVATSLKERNIIYKQNIKDLKKPPTRNVESHFNDEPGYLFHTRTSDYILPNGEATHMVHELQSDLHQQARLRGYTGKSGQRPESPLAENWHSKALEQEAIRAYTFGMDSISVPLEGFTKPLARVKGVQKWYETSIRDSMKKLAKRIGGVYSELPIEVNNPLHKHIADVTKNYKAYNTDKTSADASDKLLLTVLEAIKDADIETEYAFDMLGALKQNAKQAKVPVHKYIFDNEEKILQELKNVAAKNKVIGTITLPDTGKPKYTGVDGNAELIQPEWMKKLELYSATGGVGMLDFINPKEASAEEIEPEAEEQPQYDDAFSSLASGKPYQDLQNEYLQKHEGNSALADEDLTNTLASSTIIQDIIASGEMSEDEVKQLLVDELQLPEQAALATLSKLPVQIPELAPIASNIDLPEDTTIDLYSKSQNVHNKYIPALGGLLPSSWVGAGNAREFTKANMDISVSIANSLRQLGRNVDIVVDESGNPMMVEIDKDGNQAELTEGFWKDLGNSLVNSAAETTLGATGAIAGTLAAASAAGKAYQGPGAPAVKVAAGLLGGAAAGGVGAAGGRGLDAAYNAYQTKQDLDAKHYASIMTDAGVFSATLDLVGAPVIWGAGKLISATGRAFSKFASGNKSGAYKALKDIKHIDDTQVDAIIAEWEKATGEKAPGLTRANKALAVLPQTEPGLETVMQAAARRSPKMSTGTSRVISERSKNLQQAAKNLTSDNVGTVVTDDLNKYVAGVKDYYTGIKKLGTDAMDQSAYKFDYDELAIEPVLEDIEKRITNPAVLERFQTMLATVRDIGSTPAIKSSIGQNAKSAVPSQLRSFSDLLDLRRTINGFKYNAKISSALDYNSINKVIRNIDSEIEDAALKEMPDGKLWVQEWRKANTEYSKMIQLNENVLYRALTTDGVNHKKVVAAMRNQISSLDGTFMKVVSKLPPATRAKAEGAVIDSLVQKYTHGPASGMQATDFPALAEELRHVAFTDTKSRELKRSISELARVFKNDPDIARTTGSISKTGFNTSLTADPRAKAKFELATTLFDYIRRVLPTDKADYLALEMHVAKLLREPKNSKSIQALTKALGDDPEMTAKIRQYAIQMTKFGEPDQYPYVKVHRTGIPGKAHKASDGKLGKGIYWTTNELKAKTRASKTGGKLYGEDILPTRIATLADVEQIYGGKDVTPAMLKDPLLAKALKDKGYDGLSIADDIVVFK